MLFSDPTEPELPFDDVPHHRDGCPAGALGSLGGVCTCPPSYGQAPRPPVHPARLEPRAHARRTDPQTSHDAARSIGAPELRLSLSAVLDVIADRGPMDDRALIAAYFRDIDTGVRPMQSESGIRSRRAELVDRGLVRDTGERVTLPTGRKAIVWEAVK